MGKSVVQSNMAQLLISRVDGALGNQFHPVGRDLELFVIKHRHMITDIQYSTWKVGIQIRYTLNPVNLHTQVVWM